PPGRSSRRAPRGRPPSPLRPRSSRRRPRLFSGLALALLVGLSALAGAQPGPAAGSLAAPPTGATLGVLDAVRMTLERDPNLGLVQARVESSKGALLAASGRFDPVVTDQLLRTDVRTPIGGGASAESRTVENEDRKSVV